MKPIFRILLLAVVLSTPARALAWGRDGHELVARIAYHFLDGATRKKVLQTLDGVSFEEAATWMDDVRRNRSFESMRPWHYINIDEGQDYQPVAEKNALTILAGVIGKMKQRESFTGNRQRDLLLLFHLVGDIHQPLHAGYASDKGGNTVNVDYENTQLNLHSLWDNRIIADAKVSFASCLELYSTWTPVRADSVRSAGLMTWMKESRALLPQVYAYPEPRIEKAYCLQNKPLVEQQLLAAGLRLARVLQESFGDPS
ncbi:MAG: hypothetical protein EOO08_09230 [Chitinophagaceae bacterium]|nr:MAG: hypothetical protein EOO08_09230 [Chitinophagaceae bacterium]